MIASVVEAYNNAREHMNCDDRMAYSAVLSDALFEAGKDIAGHWFAWDGEDGLRSPHYKACIELAKGDGLASDAVIRQLRECGIDIPDNWRDTNVVYLF